MQRIFYYAFVMSVSAWLIAFAAHPATAAVHGLSGFIACNKKDAAMFDRQNKEIKAFIKKHLRIMENEETVTKNEPEKFCKWLKEASRPFRDRQIRELQTRLAGECGPDAIVDAVLISLLRAQIVTDRQIDSICSGVQEY